MNLAQQPDHNHTIDHVQTVVVNKKIESHGQKDKVKLQRQSMSDDKYSPEDSMFDIMIRNNENLITALIGKTEGDGNTNLLKTVNDRVVKNVETIAQNIEGVNMGIDDFKDILSKKFAAIKSWRAVIQGHQHNIVPIGG